MEKIISFNYGQNQYQITNFPEWNTNDQVACQETTRDCALYKKDQKCKHNLLCHACKHFSCKEKTDEVKANKSIFGKNYINDKEELKRAIEDGIERKIIEYSNQYEKTSKDMLNGNLDFAINSYDNKRQDQINNGEDVFEPPNLLLHGCNRYKDFVAITDNAMQEYISFYYKKNSNLLFPDDYFFYKLIKKRKEDVDNKIDFNDESIVKNVIDSIKMKVSEIYYPKGNEFNSPFSNILSAIKQGQIGNLLDLLYYYYLDIGEINYIKKGTKLTLNKKTIYFLLCYSICQSYPQGRSEKYIKKYEECFPNQINLNEIFLNIVNGFNSRCKVLLKILKGKEIKFSDETRFEYFYYSFMNKLIQHYCLDVPADNSMELECGDCDWETFFKKLYEYMINYLENNMLDINALDTFLWLYI